MRGAAKFVLVGIVSVLVGISIRPGDATSGQAAVIIAAVPRPLPNECAIVATETLSRLHNAGVWARMLHLDFVEDGILSGHMVTIWRPFRGSQVLVYDNYLIGCTLELDTKSQDQRDIVTALKKSDCIKRRGVQIVGSHWIE